MPTHPPSLLWIHLSPDTRMVAALDAADAGGTRQAALADPPLASATQLKKNWSNRFADACARMVAEAIRDQKYFPSSLRVLPSKTGSAEPMTFVGEKNKKLDVAVSSHLSGLQLGVSLKAFNFRDRTDKNFDKNLTGRTYELRDEMRVVHGHQPRAFMAALYFLPIASTVDKPTTSSFAHTVVYLRGCTGRLDPMLASQLDRADFAAVGLYVPGEVEKINGVEVHRDDLPRGVVRYFVIDDAPPQRGKPSIATTLTLDGMVERLLGRYAGFSGTPEPVWADPED